MRPYRMAAAGTGVAVLGAMLMVPPVATASSDGDLALVATRHSLLGTHTWYEQTYHGLPVLGGYYARHTDKRGRASVDDGRIPVPTSLSLSASVPEGSAEDTAHIKAPLQLHYAENDDRINAGIAAYEAALKANHVKYQMFMYPNTHHGFHNDTTPRYDEAAAKLAWSRTVAFLNDNLRG